MVLVKLGKLSSAQVVERGLGAQAVHQLAYCPPPTNRLTKLGIASQGLERANHHIGPE